MNDSLQDNENSSKEGMTLEELVERYKLPGEYDTTLLKGLDSIDWSKLHHAYGEASNVPALFRAILSENSTHRDFAYDLLYGTIWHQGTVYEATKFAVPFLIRLLTFDTVPNKSFILGLLDCIACGYPSVYESDWMKKWMVEQGKDFNEELRKALAHVREARDAVIEGLDQYTILLKHPDSDVRDFATALLCKLTERFELIYPALKKQIVREPEVSIKASMIKQTSEYLLKIPELPTDIKSEFLGLFISFATNPNEQQSIRFSSSVAVIYLALDQVNDTIVKNLLDAIESPPDLVPAYYDPKDRKKTKSFFAQITVEEAALALYRLNFPNNVEYLSQAIEQLASPEYAHFIAVLLLGIVLLNNQLEISYTGNPEIDGTKVYYGYENPKLPVNERKRIYPILITKFETKQLTQRQKEVLITILDCDPIWRIQSNILQMFGFPFSNLELKTILSEL